MSKFQVSSVFLLILLSVCAGTPVEDETNGRNLTRVKRFFPILSRLGARCEGCPQHFCNDDPAIIHGYCCGCAKLMDKLPIYCPHDMHCPRDGSVLCHDYEYMMSCCC